MGRKFVCAGVAIVALALAVVDASAGLGTGKPEGSPDPFDECRAGRCDDGTLLAREDWTDSPCGPEAVVNAMRMMCHPEVSTTDLYVNDVWGTNLGLGVRQLTGLINRNFRNTSSCPSGVWRWDSFGSGRSYMERLYRASKGRGRIALALTHAEGEYPHWYLVEEVRWTRSACEVEVRDGNGRGTIGCRAFARIANGMPWWIPTPNLAIVSFVRGKA